MAFLDKPFDFRDIDTGELDRTVYARFSEKQFLLEILCEQELASAEWPKLYEKAKERAKGNGVSAVSMELLGDMARYKPRAVQSFVGLCRGPASWWAAIVVFGDPTMRRVVASPSGVPSSMPEMEDEALVAEDPAGEDGGVVLEENTVYSLFLGWTSRSTTRAVFVDYTGSSAVLGKVRGAGALEYLQHMAQARISAKVEEGYSIVARSGAVLLGGGDLPTIPGLPAPKPKSKATKPPASLKLDLKKGETCGEPLPARDPEKNHEENPKKASKEKTTKEDSPEAKELRAMESARRRSSDW